MLEPGNRRPLSGLRKRQLELLRINNVPRFLFRAFSQYSGGGAHLTTNNADTIVPHAYMTSEVVPSFYETPECDLYKMVRAHYSTEQSISTRFSSWSASLHLVLCYASTLRGDAYVAVLDTEVVNGAVLVWYAPQLISSQGCHEYFAYGAIGGVGYTALPLLTLKHNGLLDVFPGLADYKAPLGKCGFGGDLRKDMFGERNGIPTRAHLKVLHRVATPFGRFYFPVVTALLCSQPWPWFNRDSAEQRGMPSAKELSRILLSLNISSKPSWLTSGLSWLQEGAVKTPDFPDVRQWIDLLYATAYYSEVAPKEWKLEQG